MDGGLQGLLLLSSGFDQQLDLRAVLDLSLPPVEGPLRSQGDAGRQTPLQKNAGEGLGGLWVGLGGEGQDQRWAHDRACAAPT